MSPMKESREAPALFFTYLRFAFRPFLRSRIISMAVTSPSRRSDGTGFRHSPRDPCAVVTDHRQSPAGGPARSTPRKNKSGVEG